MKLMDTVGDSPQVENTISSEIALTHGNSQTLFISYIIRIKVIFL